jgi:hypothetical protein
MTSSECVFESVQALWIVRVTEELAFVFVRCWNVGREDAVIYEGILPRRHRDVKGLFEARGGKDKP